MPHVKGPPLAAASGGLLLLAAVQGRSIPQYVRSAENTHPAMGKGRGVRAQYTLTP